MYKNCTNEFKNKIQTDGRTFKARLTLPDGTQITDGFMSLSIRQMAGEGTETLNIGTATAGTLEITMEAQEQTLTGQEVFVEIGLVMDDESVEYVPFGYFTPQKPTKSFNNISFTAYDRMVSKLNYPYTSDLMCPCDVYDILTEIEEKAGIVILNKPSNYTIEATAIAQDGESITYSYPFENCTYRDAIASIAGVYGKYAQFNRNGELEFMFYKPSECTVTFCYTDNKGNRLTENDGTLLVDGYYQYEVTNDMSYSDCNISETQYSVTGIKCSRSEQMVFFAGDINENISMSNKLMTESQLEEVFKEVSKLKYHPATVSFIGDLRLDLGDIITVYDYNGVEYDLPIMDITYTFDGGLKCSVGSYGSTEQSNIASVSPTGQAINELQKQVYKINQVIADKVTALVVDTDQLFSRDITATGTITGATLKGASGEFTKAFKVEMPYDNKHNFVMKAEDSMLEIGVLKTSEYDDPMEQLEESYIQVMGSSVHAYGGGSVGIASGGCISFTCDGVLIAEAYAAGGFFSIDKNLIVYGNSEFYGDLYVGSGRITTTNGGGLSVLTTNEKEVLICYMSSNDRVGVGNSNYTTVLLGNAVKLGSASGATVTSDARMKKYIAEINDKYESFFDSLEPVSYEYKKEVSGHTNGRKHLGFVAQDVLQALEDSGMDSSDFAGYVDVDMDGEELGLIYTEFVALNTHMIQKMQKKLAEQQNTIDSLVERIENLERRLGND